VLLEGNPGLGKTELVKQFARAVGLPWGRIQFTPDLMPSDITGTMLPNYQAGKMDEWLFEPGPVFASLLLADEINRATPKTQAAMLEAMAERQVTVLGQTYRLPEPFVVLATQNPLDHSGTYALPEAQSDRFMFKIMMPVPNAQTVRDILNKKPKPQWATAAPQSATAAPRRELFAAFNHEHARGTPNLPAGYGQAREELDKYIDAVQKQTELEAGVEQHLVTMFLASNRRFGDLHTPNQDTATTERSRSPLGGLFGGGSRQHSDQVALNKDQYQRVQQLVELFESGLGPRAVINLANAARAWALFFGANPATKVPVTAPDLAGVLLPTLRHRVKLAFDWEQRYLKLADPPPFERQGNLLEVFLADFAFHTTPQSYTTHGHYAELLKVGLTKALTRNGAS
jgi:MoxR-like ATPase